jgi:hypothetical protein
MVVRTTTWLLITVEGHPAWGGQSPTDGTTTTPGGAPTTTDATLPLERPGWVAIGVRYQRFDRVAVVEPVHEHGDKRGDKSFVTQITK